MIRNIFPAKRRSFLLSGKLVPEHMTNESDQKHIASAFAEFRQHYLQRWQTMIDAWQAPVHTDQVWLMYAANYLFNTRGVRWAFDPLRPNRLLNDLPHPVPLDPLKKLAFVLLTHQHSDHYDPVLLNALRDSPVDLVVPESMLDAVVRDVNPRPGKIVIARPGRTLTLHGISITPFTSPHISLPSTGYLVTVNQRSFLFPGDVREYHDTTLHPFAPVDTIFAHLWLGRHGAGLKQSPFLKPFCDFVLGSDPCAVVLTHLYEFSRKPTDLWHERHVAAVRDRCTRSGIRIPIHAATSGDGLAL